MSSVLFICLTAFEAFHFFLVVLSTERQENMNSDYDLEVKRKDLEIALTLLF